MKKGINRFPPNQFRLVEENLFRETETCMLKAEIIDPGFELLDDYHENIQLRNQQYRESRRMETNDDDEDGEDDDYETTRGGFDTNEVYIISEITCYRT